MSLAGGPSQTNNFTLDGVSITDSTNRAVILPDMESVQEMKVQANTYDAELKMLGKKPLVPFNDEIVSNPRARSAKLRAAAKINNGKGSAHAYSG